MERKGLEAWLERYERLWRTLGTDKLGELFTEDAVYSPGPFEEPWRGLDAIAERWEGERLGADEDFEIESEILAVENDTGVVRLEVNYGPPREQLYRDLWVVVLDDAGLCSSFEEWPFWPPGTAGTQAGSGVPS